MADIGFNGSRIGPLDWPRDIDPYYRKCALSITGLGERLTSIYYDGREGKNNSISESLRALEFIGSTEKSRDVKQLDFSLFEDKLSYGCFPGVEYNNTLIALFDYEQVQPLFECFSGVTSLCFDDCGSIRDHHLLSISKYYPNLKKVSLAGFSFPTEATGFLGLVEGCRKLMHLNLARTKISFSYIQAICAYGLNLECIDLSVVKMEGDEPHPGCSCIKFMKSPPRLAALASRYSKFSSRFLTVLFKIFIYLRVIDLSHTQIQGFFQEVLPCWKNLESINLVDTGISDENLCILLERCPSLVKLVLKPNSHSDAVLGSLKAQYPKLNIVFEDF